MCRKQPTFVAVEQVLDYEKAGHLDFTQELNAPDRNHFPYF
jgi:hypothetical protein